jgi:hypothetical protein
LARKADSLEGKVTFAGVVRIDNEHENEHDCGNICALSA